MIQATLGTAQVSTQALDGHETQPMKRRVSSFFMFVGLGFIAIAGFGFAYRRLSEYGHLDRDSIIGLVSILLGGVAMAAIPHFWPFKE